MTGYYGIPGTASVTKVHYIGDEGEPICGARVGRRMEAQFCAETYDPNIVECKHCRVRMERVFPILRKARKSLGL